MMQNSKKDSKIDQEGLRTLDSFEESTQKFIDSAHWLTQIDMPAVTSMMACAKELDTNGVQAALLNAYGLIFRNLMKRSSPQLDEDTFLDDLLNG